ncbi:RNA methyltransferase, TrmH family, group 1 [Methanococcus vannielii SB]|uniref:RNA methyltransferase, TrmH family, group 1 n=1 Tax=Methanococcus vannielii (strain ATCC 35089 / DSM 1224 / JCM 13029 / OCM 148 / SB) TaxID=406327 RepID=A6URX0_METVS|nr:RNA methyltransferase [Methanococcus vannielii]ABR55242.1 RNA methyltransferase, TrmH family, group 1 [Methanococcus vannielii SB]
MKTVVILVNPKYGGNLGAIARNMMNFNVSELRIVGNSDILDNDAYIRAVHAKDILKNAKFYKSLSNAVSDIDVTVATTGAVSGDRNIKRIPITPRELAKNQKENEGTLGIVFGREDDGLKNEDVELCDILVSVPTSEKYPIMNLSHAVSVILYEIYYESVSSDIPYNLRMKNASKIEKEMLLRFFNEFVDISNAVPEYRKEICKTIFKRIVGRAFISGKEANSLICVFKKTDLK